MGLKNMSNNFQACKSHDKRDIHVQNKFMENKYFHVLSIFQHPPFSFFISFDILIDRVYNWLSNAIQYILFPLIPPYFYYFKESTAIHAPTTVVNP